MTRAYNSQNYGIDSNQILLNDKDQQVHIRGLSTGDTVCYLRLLCINAVVMSLNGWRLIVKMAQSRDNSEKSFSADAARKVTPTAGS